MPAKYPANASSVIYAGTSRIRSFQSHRHYSCGRSDNQQAAAHAGAESQQVPEDTVLYERLHINRVEARGQGCRIDAGYIPIQAATSGTLSITADSRPVIPAIV